MYIIEPNVHNYRFIWFTSNVFVFVLNFPVSKKSAIFLIVSRMRIRRYICKWSYSPIHLRINVIHRFKYYFWLIPETWIYEAVKLRKIFLFAYAKYCVSPKTKWNILYKYVVHLVFIELSWSMKNVLIRIRSKHSYRCFDVPCPSYWIIDVNAVWPKEYAPFDCPNIVKIKSVILPKIFTLS